MLRKSIYQPSRLLLILTVMVAPLFSLTSCRLIDKLFVNVSGSFSPGSAVTGNSKSLDSKAVVDLGDYDIVVHRGRSILDDEFPQTKRLSSEGEFSFTLFEGQEFVAFLVDPSQPFRKVIGVMGISTGGNEYWEAISSGLLSDDLFLGQLSSDDTDSIVVSEFDLADLAGGITDIDKAIRSASLDNSVRLIKNYINSDGMVIGTPFVLEMTMPGGLVANQWMYPTDYEVSMSYGIAMGNEEWRGAPDDAAYLTAPVDLRYREEEPLLAGTPIYANAHNHGGYSFGNFDDIVPGYWQMYYEDKLYMEIDLTGGSPVLDGKLIQPTPALKLTTDPSTGRALNVELSWYLLDQASEYAPVTEADLQLLETLLDKHRSDGFNMNLHDNSRDPDVRPPDYQYSYRAQKIDVPEDVYLTAESAIVITISTGIWGLGGYLIFEFSL
jgi:hypothetical protein